MFGLLFRLNPSSDKCEENFPSALDGPWAQFWHPFPLVENPRVMKEAGNGDLIFQINHPPLGMPVGFHSSPSIHGAVTAVGGSSCSFASHHRYQVIETRVPCSFCDSVHVCWAICLGVTLVGLIFVYGDQLGQIWWEGLPQNTDWVLISFSREEGSWGLGVHLTLTQLVTRCPHRQKWHPRSRSGGWWCAVTRMSGQSGELCGLRRVQRHLHSWVGEGKEVLNCLVCCGSLDT